jgi:hypothetical protein
MYLLSELLYGVSEIFMSAFQMEMNGYTHFDLAEDGRLCSMGPTLPGVSDSAKRRTHPSWLRRGHSGQPLPTVHGPRHGLVGG